MWFLIKAAFWLSLVVVFLPLPEGSRQGDTHLVGASEALGVVSTAISDARGFCTRHPDACATGAQALHTFGQKAQVGARMLHEFISEKLDENRDLVPPPGSRAAGAAAPAPAAAETSRGADTLEASDRSTPWRGPPLPIADPRERRA
jgi:hypothetical protein